MTPHIHLGWFTAFEAAWVASMLFPSVWWIGCLVALFFLAVRFRRAES